MRTPPPPPPSQSAGRLLYPALLASTVGMVGYFYVNRDEETYEYWEAMQTGQGMPFGDDDEEDDDDDDEEDEED